MGGRGKHTHVVSGAGPAPPVSAPAPTAPPPPPPPVPPPRPRRRCRSRPPPPTPPPPPLRAGAAPDSLPGWQTCEHIYSRAAVMRRDPEPPFAAESMAGPSPCPQQLYIYTGCPWYIHGASKWDIMKWPMRIHHAMRGFLRKRQAEKAEGCGRGIGFRGVSVRGTDTGATTISDFHVSNLRSTGVFPNNR
eukprot:COSAG05_NODE_1644_length_4351_cov_343.181091_5_plen_190_part_00